MFLGILRGGGVRTCRKGADRLFLIILEHFEVALRQVLNVFPFFVSDHSVDQYQARFFLDRRTERNLWIDSCRCRRRSGRCRILRTARKRGERTRGEHYQRDARVREVES